MEPSSGLVLQPHTGLLCWETPTLKCTSLETFLVCLVIIFIPVLHLFVFLLSLLKKSMVYLVAANPKTSLRGSHSDVLGFAATKRKIMYMTIVVMMVRVGHNDIKKKNRKKTRIRIMHWNAEPGLAGRVQAQR